MAIAQSTIFTTMTSIKITVPRLMLVHLVISILICLLALVGFSHRSTFVVSAFQLPLFAWPLWFLFLGRGWLRLFPVTLGLVVSLIMAIAFLTMDENRIGRRRFPTQFGQIYVVQQFDFDGSKELPDKVSVETPLPFGFVRTVDSFPQEKPSIGKIHVANSTGGALELKGDWGSYKFKYDGNRLKQTE